MQKKFLELTTQQQDEIIKDQHEVFADTWDEEHISEDFQEFLEILGFYEIQLSWRGFWSQGDGACFTAKHSNNFLLDMHQEEIHKAFYNPECDNEVNPAIAYLDDYIQKFNNLTGVSNKSLIKKFNAFLQTFDLETDLVVDKTGGFSSYHHEKTIAAELTTYGSYDYESEQGKEFETVCNELETAITDFVRELSKIYYKRLEADYNYHVSEENIRQNLSDINDEWDVEEETN